MANLQQVLAYLQQHRTRYPIATLKAGLLKQGVPEALIEQAIASLSGTSPTPPPPTQPPGAPAQRTPVPGQQPPAPAPTQPPAQRPPAQQFPFRTPTQIGLPGQRLPVPAPTQPPAPVPAPAPTQPPAPAGKPGRTYVLVVDDDALIRDMLVAKLEGAGYRVTCAEDAAQSVIQAEGMKLSLIISDIEMPGFGTGVDALKKLRASSFVRRDMPVIFVTGMPPHEAQKIVPKTDPYLRLMHKPVDWRLMRQFIKELTGMDNPLD
ncbi:MAG: response regulator [Elusimicrobia bacterium]|nr:response regulator [Elusimicrobiota bacterium]